MDKNFEIGLNTIINMYADQLTKEAEGMGQAANFEWLYSRIRDLAGPDPRLTEKHFGLIEEKVNQERIIVSGTTSVLTTNTDRKDLIQESDLARCDYYWARFKNSLSRKISRNVARDLDETVNRIMLQLPNPGQENDFLCKGLVIGDVQAGKTNNYTALINKCADLGYKVIIVLTGVTEPLRQQTQKRLDADFVGRKSIADRNLASHESIGVGLDSITDDKRVPNSLTDAKLDFARNNGVVIASQQTPVLIVTKKNKHKLDAIVAWLTSESKNSKNQIASPVLVIDDEADNASVNTADEDQDPKAINLRIRRILKRCSKVSYVAYTATPFANVFIDPDLSTVDPDDESDSTELVDLFPSHFIVALNPPSNYCGGKFFYADDDTYNDESAFVRRYIHDAEAYIPLSHKSDLAPKSIPPSMKEALASFFVAAAIKDIRRSTGELDPVREKYDSCLINVSRFTSVQSDLKYPVLDYVELLWEEVNTGHESGLGYQAIREIFESHYKKVVGVEEDWESVKNALRTMEQPAVLTVHSRTKDELDYGTDIGPKKVIAIGGFKLSRGLTLDGLVVSYFYRRSLMYDTLMQMARWFGYRDGYRDLLRLYTTSDARKWYWHITQASEELKADMLAMEGRMEPKDFGIRVRSHEDALIVTAKNKMRTATEVNNKESFQNSTKESVFVDIRKDVNRNNISIVERFFMSKKEKCRPYDRDPDRSHARFHIIENVSATESLSLLGQLDIHWGNKWARTDRLIAYLEKHSTRAFSNWDIAFQTPRNGEYTHEIIPGTLFIKTQTRRPYKLLKPIGVGSAFRERVERAFALSDNRRVAAGDIDYVGIPEGELTESARGNAIEARDWKMKNRPNPLLVFHLIHVPLGESLARLEEKIESDVQKGLLTPVHSEYRDHLRKFMSVSDLDDYYLGFTISIPGNPQKDDDGIIYQISKRAFEEEYGVIEYDE